MSRQRATPSDRDFFEERVFRPETPCWNWRAYVGKNGYGKWVRSDRQAVAHRVAYEMFVGPIPEGMQLHHKCFNRSCVNPEHLEPVTAKENKARSLGVGAINKAKNHCVNGHPFDEANTYRTKKGHRGCRACRRESARVADEKRRRAAGMTDVSKTCLKGHPWTPENTVIETSGARRCRICRDEKSRKRRKPGGYFDTERERATHCVNGHEYTPENTYEYVRNGRTYRYCRECNRAAARATPSPSAL